jgi:hypothetical protein
MATIFTETGTQRSHNRFEGRPCKNCGSATRYVSGRGCVACINARTNKAKIENRERYLAHKHASAHRTWKKKSAIRKAAQAKRAEESRQRTARFVDLIRFGVENEMSFPAIASAIGRRLTAVTNAAARAGIKGVGRSSGNLYTGMPQAQFLIRAMATPKWVDQTAILEIYRERDKRRLDGEDAVVDHIVPIKHPRVCGLHVPWNLCIINNIDNQKKSNKFEG